MVAGKASRPRAPGCQLLRTRCHLAKRPKPRCSAPRCWGPPRLCHPKRLRASLSWAWHPQAQGPEEQPCQPCSPSMFHCTPAPRSPSSNPLVQHSMDEQVSHSGVAQGVRLGALARPPVFGMVRHCQGMQDPPAHPRVEQVAHRQVVQGARWGPQVRCPIPQAHRPTLGEAEHFQAAPVAGRGPGPQARRPTVGQAERLETAQKLRWAPALCPPAGQAALPEAAQGVGWGPPTRWHVLGPAAGPGVAQGAGLAAGALAVGVLAAGVLVWGARVVGRPSNRALVTSPALQNQLLPLVGAALYWLSWGWLL